MLETSGVLPHRWQLDSDNAGQVNSDNGGQLNSDTHSWTDASVHPWTDASVHPWTHLARLAFLVPLGDLAHLPHLFDSEALQFPSNGH